VDGSQGAEGRAAGDHEGKNVKQGEKSQEETHPCEP